MRRLLEFVDGELHSAMVGKCLPHSRDAGAQRQIDQVARAAAGPDVTAHAHGPLILATAVSTRPIVPVMEAPPHHLMGSRAANELTSAGYVGTYDPVGFHA